MMRALQPRGFLVLVSTRPYDAHPAEGRCKSRRFLPGSRGPRSLSCHPQPDQPKVDWQMSLQGFAFSSFGVTC